MVIDGFYCLQSDFDKYSFATRISLGTKKDGLCVANPFSFKSERVIELVFLILVNSQVVYEGVYKHLHKSFF